MALRVPALRLPVDEPRLEASLEVLPLQVQVLEPAPRPEAVPARASDRLLEVHPVPERPLMHRADSRAVGDSRVTEGPGMRAHDRAPALEMYPEREAHLLVRPVQAGEVARGNAA